MFVEFNLRLKVASVVEFLVVALRAFHSLRADGRNELKKECCSRGWYYKIVGVSQVIS